MIYNIEDIRWDVDWKDATFREKALVGSTAVITLVILFLVIVSVI